MSFLQIASWNIEHLSGASRADRRQSAFALADHIEMSGIDALALQEIYLTPADQELRLGENQPIIPSHAHPDSIGRNADLDAVCHLLEEHLDDAWGYYIVPNRSAGDRSQLCGVLWNTARLTLDGVTPLDVAHNHEGDALWDRKPHLMSFTSEIPVWRRDENGEWRRLDERKRLSLIPLHMKSNYGGVTKNRRVREKEARTLCATLQAIRQEIDPSLVMIGDTNILENTEPAIEVFVDNGFIDLNNNDSTTYWSASYGESPFDRAFVAAGRPEFRYTRQYVLRSSDLQLHDRFLSDHYMIKISVKDYVDDADPRDPG